ncbi:MAG: hypothetical protein N3F10_07925, partial [Candidatus Bathyarchaeota archaeon]|nr:hypothetical protein [Candidatus Bathyarchaeota archaeon]
DKASKAFGLGLIVRKPLVEILKRMDVTFKELDRDEAKAALERVGESKGITVSAAQLIKGLALAFFLPTGVFLATLKKVHYRSGAETEDGVILEFLAEIPRAFRPTLFYDVWLVVPKTEKGEANTKQVIKKIVEKTGVPPLTEEEWENAKPIIEKLKGKLEVKGVTENLWKSF